MPCDMAGVLFLLMMILVIGFAIWRGLSRTFPGADEKPKVHAIPHDSLAPTYTYDGEVVRWYVFVDPDSDFQHLINDRDGCCARLDRSGRVMGTDYGY